MDNREFQAHTQKIDHLVQQVTTLADENARATALELLQSIMDLHGAVMSRIVDLLSESGEAGRSSLAKLGSDPLVSGLLVLYGVHPLTPEQRINTAIERLRPQLHKQGVSAEILGISEGLVRLKLRIEGHASGSSPEQAKQVLERAILEVAPEVAEVEIEGVPSSSFIPIHMIQPATKQEKTYEESPA